MTKSALLEIQTCFLLAFWGLKVKKIFKDPPKDSFEANIEPLLVLLEAWIWIEFLDEFLGDIK